MAKQTLLILGGTGEARRLAERLCARSSLRVITSLAGRTRTPEALQGEVRVGGFGGAEGLARYLEDEGIDLMVDATHPSPFGKALDEIEALRGKKVCVLASGDPFHFGVGATLTRR
ncbi:precorrin-6A/cobalt-precorrin-6A reductase, partial [Nitratireductor aquimarinus]